MPAPAKTTDIDIVNAARSIIGDCGMDGLTMQAVAESVGIRAPSLYKRFTDREEIVRRVQIAEFRELKEVMETAVTALPPAEALRAIARIYWDLAHDRPRIYEALFTGASMTEADDLSVRTEAMIPIFNTCRSLCGNGVALAAARSVTAYLHGFISMEMAGVFQQSGGIEGSYYFGLNAVIKGIGGV